MTLATFIRNLSNVHHISNLNVSLHSPSTSPPPPGGRVALPGGPLRPDGLPAEALPLHPRGAPPAGQGHDPVLGQDRPPLLRQPALLLPRRVRPGGPMADRLPQPLRVHVRGVAGVRAHGGGGPQGDEEDRGLRGREGGRDLLPRGLDGERVRDQLREVLVHAGD